MYLLDSSNLGHFDASDMQVVQSLTIGGGGLHGTPTYWKGPAISTSTFGLTKTPARCTNCMNNGLNPRRYPRRGPCEHAGGPPCGFGQRSGSRKRHTLGSTGKGDANWKSVPGVLRAFDATDLSKEIWNSDKKAGRDRLGLLANYSGGCRWEGVCSDVLQAGRYLWAAIRTRIPLASKET